MVKQTVKKQQPAGLDSVDMESLLSRAVQKDLTDDAPSIWGGCLAYTVEAGWACNILQDDEAIAVVKSTLALKEALNRADVSAIFIPQRSALTIELAKTVCEREGQAKIIYTEVNDNE